LLAYIPASFHSFIITSLLLHDFPPSLLLRSLNNDGKSISYACPAIKMKQELVDVTVFKRGSIVVGHYVIE
jgi:hypothetical protein